MAEIIGYDIIGQAKKEPSNVIGYAVNEELTIDGYADNNANNNTTTGLADVIPGINGPKLIQSTSIYSNVPPTPRTFGAVASSSFECNSKTNPSSTMVDWTFSEAYGDYEFTTYQSPEGIYYSGIVIPGDGTYEISDTHSYGGGTYQIDFQYKFSMGPGSLSPTFHTHVGERSTGVKTDTFRVDFKEGDIIRVTAYLYYYGTATSGLTVPGNLSISIKRI